MSDQQDQNAFSEEQKQYLSGFTFGADVARAVQGLPVISGSGSNGTTLALGGGSATVDGEPVPAGPERFAYEAQSAVIASGKKLSKEEQAKREKNPLDMWEEMQARSDAGEFPKGTDVFLQKFHGLFYVAPAQDSYMCRLRIPGGQIQAWQLRGLADLADQSAGPYLDLTTRGNIQLREIPADQAMNILYGTRELNIVPLGSGGDNIRNCTSSPLSGLDPDELIETLPLAKRMHHYILNHREMYGLPRKFNIAFEGGGRIASLEDTNDIGFKAVRVSDENASDDLPAGVYFQLCLGGITGHKDFARYTGVLLRPDECVSVAGAIVRVFIRTGDRTDRKKARLKYVLDDMGFEKFIGEVEAEMGKELTKVDVAKLSVQDIEDRHAHVGVFPQKQTGMNSLGVVFPVGRMTTDQARTLADLSLRYSNGDIRLTVWQNLMLTNISDADLPAVQEAIRACGLDYEANSIRAGLVACTGSAGCKFAGAPTKANAMAIAEKVESVLTLDLPVNIHLTGCHHSCAQHYIGDIGLIACKVEVGDDMVDGYHICLGGGWGSRQGIAREIFTSIPFEDVPDLVTAILTSYQQHRQDDQESFHQFASRLSDDELKNLIAVPVAA
ncbi:NirA family protein [Rhodopirellula sp. JC740]|uniref:NirA family protein n=1 Tax=Rhodopirellula halodulae TaxID=2894198 RepID=A0ABS8NI85_9BACT|nr:MULTISPECIES: NirA family protein [unclassified Rhodopirellula]MCC9643262.1 NirA family protein [Rhodopirellula sp. JC740]MCC9655068.1 NirA family protein [Rhodopirellula sp. JC737]